MSFVIVDNETKERKLAVVDGCFTANLTESENAVVDVLLTDTEIKSEESEGISGCNLLVSANF